MVSPTPQISFHSFIEKAFLEGRACYGELGLDRFQIARHLALVTSKHLAADASVGDVTAFLNGLHYSDLYLVFACLEQHEIAWTTFIESFRNYILDLAGFFAQSRDAAYEIGDDVLVDMFLRDHSGRIRIASYDGRSSLARWLRVIVYHRVSDEYRRKWNDRQPLDVALEISADIGADSIEADLRASRYGALIAGALEETASSLTTDEKLFLLMRYEQGLQVNEIARLRRINPAAISRRLKRIQRKINCTFTSILQKRHGLSDAAINECKGEIVENPAYSILALFTNKQGRKD